jgi:hypothetical protein
MTKITQKGRMAKALVSVFSPQSTVGIQTEKKILISFVFKNK